jgi:hypothetical protein
MNPWVKRAALAALPYAIRKFQQRQAATSSKPITTVPPPRRRRMR